MKKSEIEDTNIITSMNSKLGFVDLNLEGCFCDEELASTIIRTFGQSANDEFIPDTNITQ